MLNYRSQIIFILFLSADLFSANLQSKDIFFISSFKSPDFIAGNHRKVYIGKEKNVLVFDKGQNKWEKSIQIDETLKKFFFSETFNRLRVETSFESFWEYNEVFEDWTSVDKLRPVVGDSGEVEQSRHKEVSRISGMVMPGQWHHSLNQIRDPNLRWAPITRNVLFDYDDLWVLTKGLGIFRGSERKKNLKSVWMGLDESNTLSLFNHKNKVLIGSNSRHGSLVMTKTNLQKWQHYEPRNRGFINGKIYDMAYWNEFYWLATPEGVIRFDERNNSFYVYDYFKGLRSDHAYVLEVHQGKLFAGTERGIAVLESGKEEFQFIPHSHILNARVNGLSSEGSNLWVSTRFGIYRYVDGRWEQPKYIKRTKGVNIPDAIKIDGDFYWIQDDELNVWQKTETPRVLFKKKGAKKLKKSGPFLMVLFDNGVNLFNLKNHLSVDFFLIDGIIGGKVNDAILINEDLWVATDEGVSKIKASYYLP